VRLAGLEPAGQKGEEMVKLVVAYRQPRDVEEFERRYRDEHVEMARRIPHKSRLELSRVTGTLDGSPAAYCRIAEFYFEDESALGKAGASAEGQAAFRHAAEIGTGGLDAMVLQVES
jgi:uncharacterized protein (TIGR02118 family)